MDNMSEISNIESEKWKALLIAISDYGDNLPKLDYCKNDGESMYELLKSLTYDIPNEHKLIGEVKYENMRDTIINFFTGSVVNPHDTLVFYFTGHGVLDSYADSYLASLI